MFRPLHEVAAEVRKDWKNVNYAAKPYLAAMFYLGSMNDMYGADSAQSVVRYFLSNATSWRGDTAKRVKKELTDMLKKGDMFNTMDEFDYLDYLAYIEQTEADREYLDFLDDMAENRCPQHGVVMEPLCTVCEEQQDGWPLDMVF